MAATAFSIYPGHADPFLVASIFPSAQIIDALGYLLLIVCTKFL